MFIKKEQGFLMVELIIAIVIISITVISVLQLFSINTKYSADPMIRKQLIIIAEGLMEEVSSKDFNKPTDGFAGPYTLANRAFFDTVTDYNGLSINPIQTLDGATPVELNKYNAQISVTNSAIGTIPNTDAYEIQIVVNGPDGQSFNLTGKRINYE